MFEDESAKAVSSANSQEIKSEALGKSFMKMRNRRGPRTDPCGTPHRTRARSDNTFLPLGKKPKGYCYEHVRPSLPPSVPPSVRGHFSFRAVQGAFLHQSLPFLVCRLVIKLFCGSFNDFGEIPFLGPKTARCVPKICHFLKFHIFLSAGSVSSPNIAIFGL